MRRPALLAVALAVLTLLAPATAVATPVSALGGDTVATDSSLTTAPPDPASDVLGWENGYWYNESIDVDSSDGLDSDELDTVVARAMARVEELRELEFEQSVPVDIYTRAQLLEETGQTASNSTANDRLHQNVKYEAMFMVGESTDAVAVQQSNQGSSIGGYYSPTQDRIVVVANGEGSAQVDESTLGHELTHALQDQHFGIESFNASTREEHNAHDGLVEGDANYVGSRYRQRCGLSQDAPDAWGSCLTGTSSESGGSGGSLNLGLYLVVYQPYSDGPSFVKARQESGGWAAVDAMYDNPPASTEQTIHPEKYGEDEPTDVTIEDRSDDRWNVLDLDGPIDYAEFGEAGLAAMFIYPTYASQGQGGLLSPQEFLNLNESGTGTDSFDPLNYDQSWSNGWDGDKLLPYVTDESASTNETGYVWKMQWDSPAEAEEFHTGYQKLLRFHDARQVGQNTYVVEDGEYADAFHIAVEGNTTTIVNAPTVEELSGVDSSISVQAVENGTTGTNATTDTDDETNGGTATTGDANPTTGDTGSESSTLADTTDTDTSGGSGPGFGVVVALLALLAVATLARRE